MTEPKKGVFLKDKWRYCAGHKPLRKEIRQLHTRDGFHILDYVEVHCECGQVFTVDQRGPYAEERYGFGLAEDDVREGKRHFRAKTYLRRMPVDEVVKVCVDAEGRAWRLADLDDAMEATAADLEAPPQPIETPRPRSLTAEEASPVMEIARRMRLAL